MRQQRVYQRAIVIYGGITDQLNRTRVRIDLHFSYVAAIREREKIEWTIDFHVNAFTALGSSLSKLKQPDAAGIARNSERAVFELNMRFVCLEQARCHAARPGDCFIQGQ